MAASVPNGHPATADDGSPPNPPPSSSSLVFLGTGCSSAVPNARVPDPASRPALRRLLPVPLRDPGAKPQLQVPSPSSPPTQLLESSVSRCCCCCCRAAMPWFLEDRRGSVSGFRPGRFCESRTNRSRILRASRGRLDLRIAYESSVNHQMLTWRHVRCCTSLLIDYCQDEGAHKYIIIDVGKTFREQVLRWFVRHKIPCVDSILLTHEHADAILGLDDVRVVQPFSPTNDIDPTPIYLSQYAMDSISQKFPYLVKKKLKEGEEVRRVAQLDWRIIESDLQKPFTASGLEFVPLPVIHGEDYICLGFLFGRKSKVAYISDVSRFPPSTEDAISKSGGGQLDLLILDCLYRTGSHNVHLCWDQTLDALKRICPKKALLIGLTHEMDHHKDNQTLEEWSRREGIDVQLARDGLRVYVDL